MKSKGMKVINNELYIGEYKASELAKKYQTPLYIYDEESGELHWEAAVLVDESCLATLFMLYFFPQKI